MTDERGRVITAATDGACSGNPGPGGWGALIRFENGSVEEFGGFEQNTTNNRMELQAALVVLKHLKPLPKHPQLTIRTDSKYLINGLTQWISGWKRNGWRTSSGKQVLNQDLWEALDLANLPDVSLEYVKGHSGDIDNERVDKIAVSFSKGALVNLKGNNRTEDVSQIIDIANSQSHRPAPPKLQRLLSRLELANYLARTGYSLTLSELAELVEQPIEKVKQNIKAWRWRDWIVEPTENNLWKLRSIKQKKPGGANG